jgi:hypothetical protein
MKKLLILILILLFPLIAFSHPGRTDKRGGHRCWKNCGNWGLNYREYHLHDKNWKPIRLDKKGNPIVPPLQATGSEVPKPDEPSASQSIPEETPKKSVTEEPVSEVEKRTVYTNITTIEESLPFNPLLIPLLFLLFLALILIRRKRKDQDR